MSLQHLAWALAFATALVAYRVDRGRRRFVLGLWLGGLCAHAGWGLFQLPEVLAHPGRVLQPGAVSVLFVPLGVLLVAPFREALAALPLPLAIARLGCLPYACCYAPAWRALPEICGLVALHVVARRFPRHAAAIVLCGFGALRLLCLPLRAPQGAGPFLDPVQVAGAWIIAGVALRDRIGSAATAREWLTPRSEPLLRALLLMLAVWLALPLAALLFPSPSAALLLGSALALALLLALRRPALEVSPASLAICAGALALGAGAAALAGEGLRRLGSVGHVAPDGGTARAVALVAIAPVVEELLYRERLLGVLRELWGAGPALVLSSALFALSHLDPAALPIAFAGGLVCGAAMLRTGSLAAVIGLHVGWNLGVVVAA